MVSAGVIIKADKSVIALASQVARIHGSDAVTVDSFDNEGANGYIRMGARAIIADASYLLSLGVGKDSGLELTSAQAQLAGPSVRMAGRTAAQVLQGARAMVPAQWANASANAYDGFQKQRAGSSDVFQDTQWMMPWTPEALTDVGFTYRTSADYGTLAASEVDGRGFFVYQPFWAFLAGVKAATVPVRVDKWTESEIAGTKPWPGTDAWSKGYVRLVKETNVASATGTSADRDKVVAHGGSLSAGSFDTFEVVTH